MKRPRAVRVLTADHNQMACRLLSEALNKEPGIAVVGAAADYDAFVRQVQTLKPDLALLSASLPGGPLRNCQAVNAGAPQPPCPWVALLDDNDPQTVVAAFRAGAKGVFSRTQADIRFLAKCIRRVTEG
ncbi:MAG TPA: response regulator, partial [Candidatus Angelobacter sp.]|nr:response regulator [Candidatus Angelobacter sp.]